MNIKNIIHSKFAKIFIVITLIIANCTNLYANALIPSDKFGTIYQSQTSDDFGAYHTRRYTTYEDSYTLLRKLLNNYNAVSNSDIQGGHIVGPIVARGEAYGTDNVLYASDYTRGIPSYVGKITDTGNLSYTRADGYTAYSPRFSLNYGFSITLLSFYEELLYTKDDVSFFGGGWNIDDINEHIVKSDTDVIFSPNGYGQFQIYQNDDFFSHGTTKGFDAMWEEIISQSESLAENPRLFDSTMDLSKSIENIDSRIDENGFVDIKMGEWVEIADASLLEQINLVVPEGFDYNADGWTDDTIINITDTSINPRTVKEDWNTEPFYASILPEIKFKYGEGSTAVDPPIGNKQGQYYEYNEYGHKLIFNMPNLGTADGNGNTITAVSTHENGANIPGHLIMPNAEFWNCTENGGWEGGNIDGCIIAQAVHVGRAEMHMWPYDGLSEINEQKYANVQFSALKLIDGQSVTTGSAYEFRLTYIYFDDTDLDGYDYYEIIEANDDGTIDFPTQTLVQPGKYTFIIKEQIPLKNQDETIIYDQTVYELEASVELNSAQTELYISNISITKTHDEYGTLIENSVSSDYTYDEYQSNKYNVTFNNQTVKYSLPITGGQGINQYTILGFSLILVAIFVSIKNKNSLNRM